MKKIFRFSFLFLILFLTINFVNAEDGELVCSPGTGEKVDIEKDGIKPTGWEAKLPICTFKTFTGNYTDSGSFDSLDGAWNHRLDTTIAYFESEDAKSVESSEVPVCSDEKARVKAVVSCKKEIQAHGAYNSTCTDIYSNLDAPMTDSNCNCFENSSTGKYSCSCKRGCFRSSCDNSEVDSKHLCCKPGEGELIKGKCVLTASFTAYIEAENGSVEDIKDGNNSTPGTDADGNNTDWKTFSNNHKESSGWQCTRNYTLQCPIYVCQKEYSTLETCVPTYKLPDGSPAYCVNPSNGFNGDYQVDSDFDVNKCASSNSTIDCGYANILIEAEYHKKLGETVEDEAINLAMRIWGAHSGQLGYDKTGVANVTGCNCSNPVLFLTGEDGQLVNVYMYMKKYLKEHFEEIAYKYDYIPPNNGALGSTTYDNKLGEISCENIGLTCGNRVCSSQTGGGNDSIYRKAIDLFFNTLIGNKEMINHLNDVVGGIDTEPDGVSVIVGEETSNGENKVWLDITYDEFSDLGLEDNVVYDCKELRESTEILDEDKQKIYPYCQTVYYLVDENGNRISDSNGNVYDPIKVEECKKGSGCTTEEFSYAVGCRGTQTVTPINIKAYYYESNAKSTIQKYQSCANANANQVMFGLVRDRIESDPENSSEDPRIIYRDPVESRGTSKNYSFFVSCGDPTCNETGTNKNDNFGSCAVRKDGELTYTSEGSYTNYIKDPSLKCIVNMTSNYKQLYDYSDHFGVNKNLCRVYCSDEVDYVLANKINAVAGETFDYNIELAMYKEKQSSHHLSSVIREKRTCSSEIYYTKNFPDEIHNKIKSTYNLTDAEADKARNISSLLVVLMTKAQASEGGREEVVNQVLYDLYNCNIYKEEFDSKIKTPKNTANARVGKDSHGNKTKFNKVYDFVDYLYGSVQNNYGLNKDCTLNKNTNTCINMTSVNYEFGAETKTGKVNNVNLASAMDSLRADGIQNVQYCTNVPGKDCFEFVASKDHQDYDYNNNNNWSNTSSNGKAVLFGKEYEIPTNDYAMFEVSIDIGFYNKDRFQTKPGDGTVIELSKEDANNKYITLDPYKYPISKNALTFDTNSQYCKTISSDTKSTLKRCNISQVLGASEANNTKIYTFYRNQNNDQFFRDINSSDNRFNCVIDVRIPKVTTCKDCSLDISTVYRNADESKLFPNGVIESSNWATVEGQIAANAIESTSDMIRNSNDLLEYSISLTPEQIRALKEYNATHKDFVSEEIDNCEITNGIYRNCRSTFLEILRGNTTELGTTQYGTLNPEYNGSKHFSGN